MNRPDSEFDARLGELLRGDALPEPPAGLVAAVRRRVRRRRLRRVGTVAALAAVLVTAFVGWREWPRSREPVPVVVVVAPPADDLAEAAVLFDPPPVDPLDRLTRQQSGYVVAMQQMK